MTRPSDRTAERFPSETAREQIPTFQRPGPARAGEGRPTLRCTQGAQVESQKASHGATDYPCDSVAKRGSVTSACRPDGRPVSLDAASTGLEPPFSTEPEAARDKSAAISHEEVGHASAGEKPATDRRTGPGEAGESQATRPKDVAPSRRRKPGRVPRPVAERLEQMSIPEPNSGCYLWTGRTGEFGHGRMLVDGKGEPAHRISWVLAGGSVPKGLSVLHKCDNPVCVRPDHLFLGTQKTNVRDMIAKGRGHSPSDLNRGKTCCDRGHQFTPANTCVETRGKRACRECKRERERRRRALMPRRKGVQ